MRTKTLLLSAAALAAGLISSFAQSNVYSANVVGYINVTLTNAGFTLVANQLDFDGTGSNNTILTAIGTNLPSASKVLAWNTNSQTFSSVTWTGTGWTGGAASNIVFHALQPGGGVFVQIPPSVTSPTNIVLVGTVLQQTNQMGLVPGFQIASYPFPVAGGLTTNLNYIPNTNNGGLHDQALTWNIGSQLFTTHNWTGTAWTAGDPQLGVGVAVFLKPWQQNTWTNSFIVQ